MITYTKSLTTIIFVFVSLTCCLGQDVMMNSQADIDAFDPSTTVINGNLFINGFLGFSPVTNFNNLSNLTTIVGNLDIKSHPILENLDGLSGLTSIGGNLNIEYNDVLANINGLSNLTSVGGNLSIPSNNALTNIDGLSNLTSIGGYLYIGNNITLADMDGLSNLTSIDGGMYINDNISLTNINGLSNLISVGGGLHIINHIALTNIDGLSNLISVGGFLNIESNNIISNIDALSNLTAIGGYFKIVNNDALPNIDGLSNLTSIDGYLEIRNNDILSNIDGLSNLISINGNSNISNNDALTNINALSNLVTINGYLYIGSNDVLPNVDGLSNLTSIEGNLLISYNSSLTNIAGLSNLISIGGNLSIEHNSSLPNIDDLSNLTSIGGNLNIVYNPTLTNIDGLFNLTSIGGSFSIENNDALTDCCGIQSLLATPEAISSTISIWGNPSECNNEDEILNTCGLAMKIFNDINQNCINNNELGIANQMFIIQPGNIIRETNLGGYWLLDSLPLGDYTITIDTSGSWSPTCPVTQSFTVSDPFEETILPTFGLVSTEPCTAPDINIHMPFMRPCFGNQRIYIQACNTSDATGTLENAYVVLELDSLLMPTSSSIPYTDLGDNMYQFDIGTLNPGICSEFWMETTLSCDAILGQSLCMEANLFPAEDCIFDDLPQDTSICNTVWDMSSLGVEGDCENGVVVFKITNNGSGDMTCFSPVRIYINGNLIILDSVQLVSGEIATFSFSGDGESWRLDVDQHPLHPGNSQPNAVVEGCGGTIASLQSLVNAMYLDDADPVVDIYCGTVTGSYDPNDKTGFPLGVNESHDILPNQQIEYLIRFQNTGTDTAFTVVIRDTLSTNFDIFSVESGVASHSYDFEMYGPRVMQWTFNNILLPDSTTNESGSHGFIKFTVNQVTDLTEGIVLENSAAIYFDFNEPIITNTSEHTINYFTPNFVTTNISEEVCDSYTSPSENNVWTNSGTYYDVIETENGDSIIVIDLVVTTSFSANITGIGGNTLIANIPSAEYQWLDCNNNFAPISGATSQEFTAMETIGDYAVQIILNGCEAISDCYHLNTTGIEGDEFASSVSIHPNPTNNYVSVDLGRSYQGVNFTLRNILGQTIFKKNVNTTSEFQFEINEASGLYLLQIERKTGESATFKILKK